MRKTICVTLVEYPTACHFSLFPFVRYDFFLLSPIRRLVLLSLLPQKSPLLNTMRCKCDLHPASFKEDHKCQCKHRLPLYYAALGLSSNLLVESTWYCRTKPLLGQQAVRVKDRSYPTGHNIMAQFLSSHKVAGCFKPPRKRKPRGWLENRTLRILHMHVCALCRSQ